MRTSNPVLNSNAFGVSSWDQLGTAAERSGQMTIQGVVNKSLILLGITGVGAVITWEALAAQKITYLLPLVGGGLGALIVSLIACFAPRTSPFTAPLYALLKGPALAALSMLVASGLKAKLAHRLGGEAAAAGLVFQAVFLTFSIFIGLLLAYTFRLIRLGSTARRMVVAATIGLCFFYLATFLLSLFGINLGFIHGSGPFGIGFSLIVVFLASLNLVMDFQDIERRAEEGAPKWMEWFSAFGLLVTLVWLYVEVLRLLAKLKGRD